MAEIILEIKGLGSNSYDSWWKDMIQKYVPIWFGVVSSHAYLLKEHESCRKLSVDEV